MFKVIYKSKYGDTVDSDDPKMESYKYMAYLRICRYESITLTVREGHYTVSAPGLMSITYAPVLKPAEVVS